VAEPHDAEAGAMAARYLVERGHRRLAFLDPRLRHAAFRAREAAFRYAAEDGSARVLVLRSQIAEARARQPLGAIEDLAEVGALVDRWQKLKDKERPTAIFVPADNIAALVYRALGERGLRIPRDVSLVSCNREAPLLMGLHPPLSTIDVHAEEIGRRAVDLLIWRFAHPMGPPVHLQIEPTLVEGASVAILRPGA
jgi:DNA-binding LacI/PurR family transcriptional regulator